MGAKCRRMASQIFRYAAQTARATTDPAALLVGAIKTPGHEAPCDRPAQGNAGLLKTIRAVPAELNTRLAFYWLLLTAAARAKCASRRGTKSRTASFGASPPRA